MSIMLQSVLNPFCRQLGISNEGDADLLMKQFLTVQTTLVPWSNVGVHITDIPHPSEISYRASLTSDRSLEGYTRSDGDQHFNGEFWKQAFENAELQLQEGDYPHEQTYNPDETETHRDPLALYHHFVESTMASQLPREDQRLMMFYLLNMKEKNLKALLSENRLGLPLPAKRRSQFYTQMMNFRVQEDQDANVSRELALLLNRLRLPSVANAEHAPDGVKTEGDTPTLVNAPSTPLVQWSRETERRFSQHPVIAKFKKTHGLPPFASTRPVIARLVKAHEGIPSAALMGDLMPYISKATQDRVNATPEMQSFAVEVATGEAPQLVQRMAILEGGNRTWKQLWNLTPRVARNSKGFAAKYPTCSPEVIDLLVQEFE